MSPYGPGHLTNLEYIQCKISLGLCLNTVYKNG